MMQCKRNSYLLIIEFHWWHEWCFAKVIQTIKENIFNNLPSSSDQMKKYKKKWTHSNSGHGQSIQKKKKVFDFTNSALNVTTFANVARTVIIYKNKNDPLCESK